MKHGSKLRRQIDIRTRVRPLYITVQVQHIHLSRGGSYHRDVSIDIGRLQILICQTRRLRKMQRLSLGGGRKKVLAAKSWRWRILLVHLSVRDWRMHLGWDVRIGKWLVITF